MCNATRKDKSWGLATSLLMLPVTASAGSAHLNDGQAKGLLKSDIGENALGLQREAVDIRDVTLLMLLGVGDAPIQVVGVDQLQDLVQHLGRPCCHAVDVFPIALRNHSNASKCLCVLHQARCRRNIQML